MEKRYSFKTGFGKALLYSLSSLGVMATFMGYYDVSIADMITKHVLPLVGSVTVGGLITLVINFVKFKFSSN